MMALFQSFRTMCLLLAGFAVICQAEISSIKAVEEYKTVIPGQTVTLECRAPGGFPLAGVEWIRRELTKENVFFCSPGEKPNLETQHPSFKNRVELEDGDMTDGNVSVILKNVTSNDTGTYECHVIPETTHEKRSAFDTDPIKIIHLNVSQPVEEYKTVIPGQTVTLECRAPGGFPLAGVEWIRHELTKENVFFCSPGEKPNLETQHPSFKNRVELEDGDMTYGNVSVILKNVTSNDTGTYECHVIPETTHEKRSAFDTDPIKIIHLNVSQPGDTEDEDHGVWWLLAVAVAAAAAAAVIGVVVVVGFVMRCIQKRTHSSIY
ncbi:CD226 antigen-like [Trachinotus anak]|uniref:CD226 antigen-like n=1 Tax=Trachinotus anak TaxID=443729 RepID=UPI0039F24AF6